jgi:hypothetical protein
MFIGLMFIGLMFIGLMFTQQARAQCGPWPRGQDAAPPVLCAAADC